MGTLAGALLGDAMVIAQGVRTVLTGQTNPLKNIILGAGLAYALSERKYIHLPAVFVCPSIYAGYQCYTNRDTIMKCLQ
jgi:hypothetical protein